MTLHCGHCADGLDFLSLCWTVGGRKKRKKQKGSSWTLVENSSHLYPQEGIDSPRGESVNPSRAWEDPPLFLGGAMLCGRLGGGVKVKDDGQGL